MYENLQSYNFKVKNPRSNTYLSTDLLVVLWHDSLPTLEREDGREEILDSSLPTLEREEGREEILDNSLPTLEREEGRETLIFLSLS